MRWLLVSRIAALLPVVFHKVRFWNLCFSYFIFTISPNIYPSVELIYIDDTVLYLSNNSFLDLKKNVEINTLLLSATKLSQRTRDPPLKEIFKAFTQTLLTRKTCSKMTILPRVNAEVGHKLTFGIKYLKIM